VTACNCFDLNEEKEQEKLWNLISKGNLSGFLTLSSIKDFKYFLNIFFGEPA